MSEMVLAARTLGIANCYILGCAATREAAVIDPGVDDPWIKATLAQHGLTLRYILLTHSHGDHIMGIPATKAWSGVPVLLHRAEDYMLKDPMQNFSAMMGAPTGVTADRLIEDGELITLGQLTLEVRHTPGHSPGGVSYYLAAQGVVFTGDALFAGSVGRTDFPGCDASLLVPGIKAKLLTLPKETVVYSGHGPATTIGDEAEYNPFLS